MANTLKLPVGIESFEEIRKLGFYYIDKTRLIERKRSIGGTLVDLPIFLDNQLTKVIGIFAEFVEFADYVE